MVRIENLRKSYGSRLLFDGVTFNINSRERIGLVGRNGHGKTTLFRLLLGREEPDSGEIAFPRGYTIGHLDQHLAFHSPTLLEEACLGLPADELEDHWKVKKVLAGLGFSPADFDRPPSSFSGGFQVRLNLAKVLVSHPDLLLLDEPTNFLDILAVRWLERFLLEWKGELLLITHDRAFMDRVVTHVAGIHRGKARKMPGNTGKYYDQLSAGEEVVEKSRANLLRKRKDTEEFIRRFRAKARLAGMVQSRVKMLAKQGEPEGLDEIPVLDFSFRSAYFPAQTLLTVKDLSFSYGAGAPALIEGLSLTVGKKDRIGVVGPNGRGKSTLLRLLAGELVPTRGDIQRHRLLATGYYGQTNVDRLHPARTIAEELLDADPERSPQRARNIAGTMMFTGDDALKKIAVLSGGERARVLLGRLLLAPAHLLLLDEPTNHLDMESGETLLEATREFPGAVVVVTHDENFLEGLVDKLVVFDGGRVTLFEGSYSRFLSEVGWESERSSDRPASEGSESPAGEPRPKLSKKERAKLVQERSRSLRPLETKVAELEAGVATAEAGLSAVEKKMIEASQKKDGAAISGLAKKNRDLAADRDRLYHELFLLTEELEAARKKWDAG